MSGVSIPVPARRASVALSPVNLSQYLNSPPTHATSPPILTALSPDDGTTSRARASSSVKPAQQGKALTPFPVETAHIKILLLENVNTAAVDMLKKQGYLVEEIKQALGEDELIEKLKAGAFQAVGIRSKTRITAKVISEVPSVSYNASSMRPTSMHGSEQQDDAITIAIHL